VMATAEPLNPFVTGLFSGSMLLSAATMRRLKRVLSGPGGAVSRTLSSPPST